MYQAGVKRIKLYENIGIDFRRYDPNNLRAITDLINAGAVITVDNESTPEFDIKFKFKDGNVSQDYSVEFYLLGYTLENYDLLNQIKSSIYGWCFLVEYYDGSFKFYNCPLNCRTSELKPHKEMSFKVTLENAVSSIASYYELAFNISTVPIYRADTIILTADTTIYTADYAL